MEDELDKGDATGLIAFIKELEKAGLLDRYILTSLCSWSVDHLINVKRWDVLHEFAGRTKPIKS
jgi:hypothetical protein